MATKRRKKARQRAAAKATKRRMRPDMFRPVKASDGGSRIESASIEWDERKPADLEPRKGQLARLRKAAKETMAGLRESAETNALKRRRFADYIDVNAHAFGETILHFDGSTLDVAKLLVRNKFQVGAETYAGKIPEIIAAAALPFQPKYGWERLDSNKERHMRMQEVLGEDITRNIDLIDVHDYEGDRMLRMVGVKLNKKTANASIMKFGSNSFSDTSTALRFAREMGASRVEIVLGIAYNKSAAQPRKMLDDLSKKLDGWQFGELPSGQCLISPNSRIRFRVLKGPELGGYLLKPGDDSPVFDLMAVLTQAQSELRGSRALGRVEKELAADMDAVAAANMEEAVKRFPYLRHMKPKMRNRFLWVNMMTGSWADIRYID